MQNLMTAEIEFDFEVGSTNDSIMQLKIVNSNEEIDVDNLVIGSNTISLTVEFPQTIILVISGKGKNDVVVDENGNIIADKYIKLVDIRVDKLSVDPHYLPRFVKILTESGEIITTNYFGFNGTVIIDFFPTPFKWLASTKK